MKTDKKMISSGLVNRKDTDRYYNDHLKLKIVRRLMMVTTWAEIKFIDGAVWEAIQREEAAEEAKLAEFEKWKEGNQNG
jgi:hypothetical protein|tara:strand:- start:198 stop:434 length:237 start_codon:yes stop_codon:yes gene_type:complete